MRYAPDDGGQAPTPTLGTLLRRARQAADLTQAALGQSVGIGQNMVSAYEGDVRTPSLLTIQGWAGACGLDDTALGQLIRAMPTLGALRQLSGIADDQLGHMARQPLAVLVVELAKGRAA